MKEQVCIKCELPKPLSDFYKSSSYKLGHRTSCKECDKQRSKDRTKKNKELEYQDLETIKKRKKLDIIDEVHEELKRISDKETDRIDFLIRRIASIGINQPEEIERVDRIKNLGWAKLGLPAGND